MRRAAHRDAQERVSAHRRPYRLSVLGLLVLLVAALVSPASVAGRELTARTALRHRVLPQINLFVSTGFRYQDPNGSACTSTSTMVMLNFIAATGTGGRGFRWKTNLSGSTRDAILQWERSHDTLSGGSGSDPHGWRNALNYYGWGSSALRSGSRVYDDFAYTSYERAMKAAVRAIAATRKPVGMTAWAGAHAIMITGYYGLSGDPFAKTSSGAYSDTFTVGGFYVTDPLTANAVVNSAVSWATLRDTSNLRLRFRIYLETDSPYDDKYTPGYRVARDEWYQRFVLVLPIA